MKVLLIDPWPEIYVMGLSKGLSKYVDLTLFASHEYSNGTNNDYKVIRRFFEKSNKMRKGIIRKAVRYLEYIQAYNEIVNTVKNERYDIVHIEWLLSYKTDLFYLKKIKKYTDKLVYTAHNVLPHRDSHKFIKDLERIYKIVDTIVVHGNAVCEEFSNYFPQYGHKLVIQHHGTYQFQDKKYNESQIDEKVIKKLSGRKRVYLFFGNMFFNKGVDRLIKIWLSGFRNCESILVVAGKKHPGYVALDSLEKEIESCPNILYLSHFIDNDTLNYLIEKANLILLPYRHASMSGVVFSAAEFAKPVLCTSVGSIEEYIVNNDNGFVVANTDEDFREKLIDIDKNTNNDVLMLMGTRLKKHIHDNYSWDKIAQKLVSEAYETRHTCLRKQKIGMN